jgi:tRNA (adenine37-N6)-methyltransferase
MNSIGIIHSPFTKLENMPIQPKGSEETEGKIIVNTQYADGLKDLDGFSHIFLIYHFHLAKRTETEVVPFMDTQERGVFATRSPLRPNHIGLSIVEVVAVKANVIMIKGVDILDGTPLLDIKPYIQAFDEVRNSKSGWMTANIDEVKRKRSDDRFK